MQRVGEGLVKFRGEEGLEKVWLAPEEENEWKQGWKRFECMIRVGICNRYAWMGRVEIVVW